MYKIRPEREEDIQEIKQMNDDAFCQENEAKLIAEIRSSDGFIPELSLVALGDTGNIIGHILFSSIHIQTQNNKIAALALAPMAVSPQMQNKGIGSALVRDGLIRSKMLGYKSVIVLGHPLFYAKFGFKPAIEYGIKPPFEVRDEVFMALELEQGSLEQAAGTVVYPPAFSNV
ncbi:N-acetyltransferase [Bacillus sp. FSL H8-0547]